MYQGEVFSEGGELSYISHALLGGRSGRPNVMWIADIFSQEIAK